MAPEHIHEAAAVQLCGIAPVTHVVGRGIRQVHKDKGATPMRLQRLLAEERTRTLAGSGTAVRRSSLNGASGQTGVNAKHGVRNTAHIA